MSGERAPDMHTLLRITDAHQIRIGVNETDIAVLKHQIDSLEKANRDICTQLVKTDERLMAYYETLTKKMDILIAKENRREGAAGLAKWMPTLINAALGLMAIIAIIQK